MGTRSLTTIIRVGKNEGKKWSEKIVTMYRQFDGYPSGHGMELAEYLAGGKLVNGLPMNDTLVFNGGGCLAASLVGHFKNGPGGIYLHRGGTKDCWEEYSYDVIVNDVEGSIIIKIYENRYEKRKKLLFSGTPKETIVWIKTKAE